MNSTLSAVYISNIAISSSISAITVFECAVLALLIIIKRNEQPFKAMSPPILLIQLFSGLIINILISAKNVFDKQEDMGFRFPCFLGVSIIVLTPSMIFTPAILRALKLLFVYNYQVSKSRHYRKLFENLNEMNPKPVTRPRCICFYFPLLNFNSSKRNISNFLVSSAAQFILYVIVIIITIVVLILLMVILKADPFQTCSHLTSNIILVVFGLVQVVFYLVMMLVLGIYLLLAQDNFGIRIGIYVSFVVYIVGALAVIPISYGQRQQEKIAGNYLFMLSFCLDCIISFAIIPAIYKIQLVIRQNNQYQHRQKHLQLQPGKSDEHSLTAFLREYYNSLKHKKKKSKLITLAEIFNHYCEKEDIQDIWLFIQIAKEFELGFDANSNKTIHLANQLFTEFVAEGAVNQVVDAKKIRDPIQQALTALQKDMFLPAVNDIEFRLKDAWGRFILTAQYKQYLKTKFEIDEFESKAGYKEEENKVPSAQADKVPNSFSGTPSSLAFSPNSTTAASVTSLTATSCSCSNV